MEANLVINKNSPTDLNLDDLKKAINHSFSKISLNDTLDYIMPVNLATELSNIKNKLDKNGVITIQGFDLYELSYGIVNDQISTIDYNNIIAERKQLLCVPDLTYLLNNVGLKVLNKHVDNYKYYIEAQNIGL